MARIGRSFPVTPIMKRIPIAAAPAAGFPYVQVVIV